jgi:putative DNA primase/helicase
MKYEFENIPDALQKRDQWILWRREDRDGDATKVPYQPGGSHASTTDPTTWTLFSAVQDAYVSGSFAGIGFVFKEDGPFVGVDLDGCVDGADITGGALDLVERLDSYTEGSPSGTGLHVICRGFLPDLGNRSSDIDGLKELEMYDQGRYFTFTGRHLDGTPKTVEHRAHEIYDLCKEVFDEPESETESTTPTRPHDLDDRQLIEKAKNAKNGDTFARLWNGDTSGNDNDHSRADLALCGLLAFWTGGDRDRIERLFRNSGLCRDKWTDRPDYRKRTLDKALDGRTEYYDPGAQADTSDTGARGDGQATEEPELESHDSWDEIRSIYEEEKKEARVGASERLIEELNVATHLESGHLYVWDSEAHVYAKEGEQAIRSRLVETLQADFSQHEAREIIGMVKPKTYRSEFGAEGFVPVANGDLKISEEGVDLKDPTPERGFRNRSEAKWDPDADAPIFETYLKSVVPNEGDRKALQEYTGYALMYWGLPYHKALFLVGPQASGKSTFLEAINGVLGKTTQLSPQQLVDDDFKAIELEDSWANIASDIPSALVSNVGRFKEITAGDRIYAERKYEQGYMIRPTAKHFYSANQLPDIKIDDNAFFRRVMIVPFPKTIAKEERDPSLPDSLKLELDGILRWAVEGLMRLLDNEEFTRDLSPSETRRLWDEHASSIGQFKVQCLEVSGEDDHAVSKTEVYDAYGEFCMDHGLPTETQRKLTRVLKRDPKIGQAKRKPEGHDSRTSCYIGVQIQATLGDSG